MKYTSEALLLKRFFTSQFMASRNLKDTQLNRDNLRCTQLECDLNRWLNVRGIATEPIKHRTNSKRFGVGR